MKGKFFIAVRKVSETGNDNLFVDQSDLVEVKDIKDNVIVFDFQAKNINHTGKPMALTQNDFEANFKEYLTK